MRLRSRVDWKSTPAGHTMAGLTFTFPAPVTKEETKHLKIPAHPYKQPAQREFPLHKRSCRTDRGPRAAWWRHPTMQCSDLHGTGARGSPGDQMESSHVQTTPPLARRLCYCMLPLYTRPRRLLQARLWGSHFSRSEESHRRWLAAPPPSFSFLPWRRWKCDFLLHLGDKKTGQEENLKLFIAALHNKPVSFELQRGRFRKMRAKRQNVMLNLEKTRAGILSYMDPTQAFTGATSTCPGVHSQNRTKQQFNKRQILH